jgi:hypothetical protein
MYTKNNKELIIMNQNASWSKYCLLLIFLLVGSAIVLAANRDGQNRSGSLYKTNGTPLVTILNINNFTSFLRADGQGNHQVDDQAGGRYPRTASTAIYEDGFVWGGKAYLDSNFSQPVPGPQLVRVGGQTYNQGTRQGWVVGLGANATAVSPDDPGARIYRIRRDYAVMSEAEVRADAATLNLVLESQVTSAQFDGVKQQYATDWANWPVNLGAPYVERNGIPGYQAPPPFQVDPELPNHFTPDSLISGHYDEPGVAGIDPNSPADQVIWTVFNDLDRSATLGLYLSEPLGLEGQVTVWGYKRADALGQLYFKRIKVLTKGGVDIGGGQRTAFYLDSMFISQWSDPDLGDSGDDLAGSDTTASLGFAYNGNAVDAEYRKYSLAPPAVGYDFLQGPILSGEPTDSAVFDLKRRYGYKNLPMTAFVYFSAGSPISDPPLANQAGASYEASTLRWWKMLRGYQPDLPSVADRYYPFPPGYTPGPFCLTGDPVKRIGFIDGLGSLYSFGPGDRRIILCSGPFRLAPGDTQEVVVGTVAGLGSDRLSSISVMKFNDRFVQNTYDALFAVPKPPPTPDVKYTELNGHVIFEWGSNAQRIRDIENPTFTPGDYTFEGYNVYQMNNNQTRDLSSARRIATYDLLADPAVVLDEQFDEPSGQILIKPVQFGSNSGVSRFFNFNRDFVRDIPRLNNGSEYTIAITAYTVSRTGYLPASLESSPFFATVTPQIPRPGTTYGPGTGSNVQIAHDGTASGGPTITLVDPGATTGHSYETFFSTRAEIRTIEGDWIPSSVVTRRANPAYPDTMTGSSIDIAGVYGIAPGKFELHCTLTLVSPDFAFSDGIRMSLPQGVVIDDVPIFTALNTSAVNDGVIGPVWVGNTIVLGDTTHPYTGNGPFGGGEEWVIYVSSLTTPASIDWKIFDDGYGAPLDAEGTTVVQNLGNLSRVAEYWNLKDATSGAMKLENQSAVNGVALFPPRNDIITNLGTNADPIVDGFQISVRDVVYAAPINYLSVSLVPGPGSTTSLTHNSSTSTLDIQNYTIFAATVSSKSIDNFGAGTNDLNELQKDYELRFTGVWDSTVVGGQTRYFIASGGQMATIFGTVNGVMLGLDQHPMNPNPGSNTPFLIRIPFEVWSKDDNRQVNLAFRDRQQSLTANPFYAWNPVNRMYAVIDNSAYDETTPRAPNASSTWVLVFYGTNYHLGDVVTVEYANPVQIGVDKWTFNTTQATYSADAAKQDVSMINVFPNPYYAFNPREISRTSRFVTFNHLPQKATIRIFNVAGQLVRTLLKDTPSQYLDWDLANEANFPVASGMYIVHVDMPDLGMTKVLKVAIIQEQEVPNNF